MVSILKGSTSKVLLLLLISIALAIFLIPYVSAEIPNAYSGLKGLYRLNNDTGIIVDNSGTGNTLTEFGNVITIPGIIDNGSNFSKSNFLYDNSFSGITNSSGIGLGGWFNLSDTTNVITPISLSNTVETSYLSLQFDGGFKCYGSIDGTGFIAKLTNMPPIGKWAHYFCKINSTGGYFYYNGVLNISDTSDPLDASGVGIDHFSLGTSSFESNHADDAFRLVGYADEVFVVNRNLPLNEIEDLAADNFAPGAVTEESINIIIHYPTDYLAINEIPNGNIWINVTHNDTGTTTCDINDTDWTDQGSTTSFNHTFLNNTFIENGNYTVVVYCNQTGTNNGTATVHFKVDTSLPVITFNNNNFFNVSENTSTVNQYLDSLQVNISFADNIDLFGYMINITRENVVYYNFTNISVFENETSFETVLDSSLWPEGNYDIEVQVSDSHTANSIKNYGVSQFLNKITFDTEEGNVVSIKSDAAYKTEYEKSKDRYSFGFDYLLGATERNYVLESDNPIYYFQDSKYKGHFVVWNQQTKNGNWIDFEGVDGKVTIIKVNDYKYEVNIKNMPNDKKVKFRSIGGLNIVTKHYSWYRGNYSVTWDSIVTTETNQDFMINISKNLTYVKSIQAGFTYNGTGRTVILTNHTTYSQFDAGFTIPSDEAIYHFIWNFNVTQTNGQVYNFSFQGNQSAFLALINITLYDEENQTEITEDATLYFTGPTNLVTPLTGGSEIIGNLSVGEYFIQAETENYPSRGIYFSVTNQTNNLDMYLVRDLVGNDYIDYYVRDDALDAVEDARLTFQKSINGSYVTVAQIETDYAGQARVFQDQQNEYRILVTHIDYATKDIDLIPLQLEYSITLDAVQESLYQNVYEGIRYTLSPKEIILNITESYYNISIDIFSDDSSLQYFGVFIDHHNYTCVPANCISNITGSPAGGVATVRIYANETGEFDVHYFFKRSGFDTQYITGLYYNVQLLKGLLGTNINNWLEDIHTNLGSDLMRNIFAAIITIVLCVLAASFGVGGISLVLIVVLANLFFSIAGFINPFVAINTIILGLASWIVLGRDL